MMLWINHEKQRYYRVVISHDLFGNLCLIRTWGSLIDSRGGSKTDIVGGDQSLIAQIEIIKRQRMRREYDSRRVE
jgi:hypothetical protein